MPENQARRLDWIERLSDIPPDWMRTVNGEILQELERRGVSRLCHFTLISNLPSIFGLGGVQSVFQARQQNLVLTRMDQGRWDRQLGHVSLSIEYPNAFLMRRYGHVPVPNRPDERWKPLAVLDIDPRAINWRTALFSPVNAATAGGDYLGSHIHHLQSLFAPMVPNPNCPTRSQRHPLSCPTDMQAEVMIYGGVPLAAIRRVFVERTRDERDAQNMRLPVPVARWPAIFHPDHLSGSIRRGEPPAAP
ncbi:MAG: DUF4433 domain-containing protein [Chloroflexi bacterium]|nr:DUF4433 domain-containing protein [Chloroflexota bacterium]